MEVTLFDKEKNKNLRQSNFLIEARYKLTKQEFRIIRVIMSMVSQYDQDFKKYQIKLADIKSLLESKSESLVADLKKATKGLLSKPVVITTKDKIVQVNWISSAVFAKGKAFVEIALDPELKPYLLEIKSYYTEFELQELLSLRSFYSLRIYELMKQFSPREFSQGIPRRGFKVEELKKILQGEEVDNYPSYGNFKDRVLNPAILEINNKTGISLSLQENKIGKKVDEVVFIITPKNPNWKEGLNIVDAESSVQVQDQLVKDSISADQNQAPKPTKYRTLEECIAHAKKEGYLIDVIAFHKYYYGDENDLPEIGMAKLMMSWAKKPENQIKNPVVKDSLTTQTFKISDLTIKIHEISRILHINADYFVDRVGKLTKTENGFLLVPVKDFDCEKWGKALENINVKIEVK